MNPKWKKEEVKLNKLRKGEQLLNDLEKSAKLINYELKEINDIDKDMDYIPEIQEEIYSYPADTKLKRFIARGHLRFASDSVLAIINPKKQYKNLSFFRYICSLTDIGERKLDKYFLEFKKSIISL